jgi:hypothetical protein
MKSRNTILLLIVLVILGVAAYFFSKKDSSRSTLNTEETAFAVTDTASVNKIFISAKAGWSHTLERKPNGLWMMDNKFEARKDMVNLLLETMRRMEVKRPADKGARNSTIRDLATKGRKVEIYQNGKLAKIFYVGQTTDDDLGTYFIMEGSENPYVLHIPGFDGFLNTRFEINESGWRTVPVFRSTAESVKELSLEYPQNPKENFKIEKADAGNTFKINGEALNAPENENMKAYLNNYRYVNGEFYFPNPNNRLTDSLALQKPVVVISVTDQKPENNIKLLLFGKATDMDHFMALNPRTKEVISVQTFVFDRLLVKQDAFRKK